MEAIKNNIYQTIVQLQGPKHPGKNYEALNRCADVLVKRLKDYGVDVMEQTFFVEGDERPYRNIIGYIGDRNKKKILIGSHYDTVEKAPGANDNLSAVAVMLEIARLYQKHPTPPALCLAFFTLEEGHPTKTKERTERLMKAGLIDENDVYCDVAMFEFSKKLSSDLRKMDRSQTAAWRLKEYIDTHELIGNELKYANILREVNEQFPEINPNGKPAGLVGSEEFASAYGHEIEKAIVLDCIGWSFPDRKQHMTLPIDETAMQFAALHKVDPADHGADYLIFMGDKHSIGLVEDFHRHLSAGDVDINNMAMKVPLDYDGIKKMLPDALRSDHAPFWKKQISALFVSDGGEFRAPMYHTAADTYEHLNYGFLEKFTKALFSYLEK